MTSRNRNLLTTGAALAAAAITLSLAGCATGDGGAAASSDGTISVVASTNVYGALVSEIGGDDVSVTSIVASLSQDPHSYEASAKDALATQKAQLVVMNGAGYDAFMDNLIGTATMPVIIASEYASDLPEGADEHDHGDAHDVSDPHEEATATASPSASEEADEHGHTHIEGFNEHVWYDFAVMKQVADTIVKELSTLKPSAASDFAARGEKLDAGLADLVTARDAMTGGDHVHIFVTEPVPLRLTDAARMHNVAPAAFTEAVEEGQDVPASVMLEAVTSLTEENVRVVISNAQTGGAETTQIIDAAKKDGIATLAFTELMPEGDTYLSWMKDNIDQLTAALKK